MKQTKTNFESFIVIGVVLIIVIPLIGSSSITPPDNASGTMGGKVFAQTSNDAIPNLQFSYTKLGVLNGGFQRIS